MICQSQSLLRFVLCLFLLVAGCPITGFTQTWYNADIHLHAQCAGIKYSAGELLDQMKQEGINVGSVLIWGGDQSLEQDSLHFRGQEDDPVSEPDHILHWDIEISELPGVWNGHMYLVNVAQKNVVTPGKVNYPGQDYLLPNFQYVQAHGGIVGYAHIQSWPLGSYEMPLPDWSGFPRELPLDVALARVDFLTAEIINDNMYWLWYGMLNAGFHLPVLGDSDLSCYWPNVGRYQATIPLLPNESLTYRNFIEAIRKGRTVIRRNSTSPDFLDIRVNDVGLGGTVFLPKKTTTVNVEVDASSAISGQRVELILNGQVTESIPITSSVNTYRWPVQLEKSGWIAAKTTGPEQYPAAPGYTQRPNSDGAHTAATFVLLGGCPVRNDPEAARNWADYLGAYYQRGVSLGEFGASQAEVRQKVDEAKLIWERIAQEGEGRVEMDCTPPFTINAGLNDAWYSPPTAGQGLFVVVYPDRKQIFIAWFTYDTERPPDDVEAFLGEPGHRWFTAQGPYEGDTAMLDVFVTEGGEFDMSDPEPVTGDPVGFIKLGWSDCENATLTYDLDQPSLSGVIQLTRIALDNVALCEALSQ